MKQKNFLKNQTITVIILATIAVVALLSYFFVVLPMGENPPVDLPPIEPRTVIGTERHVQNQHSRRYDIFMLQRVDSDDINEITVFNGEVHWSFVEHDVEGGEGLFVIEHDQGSEKNRYDTPYNFRTKEQMMAVFGSGATIDRLEIESSIDFDTFGLGDGAAYITLYQENGSWHRIYIGNRIPSGDGYYARFVSSDEGERQAVYIVPPTYSNLVSHSHLDIMLPILSFGAPLQDNFLPDSFRVYHGRELYLEVIRDSETDNEEHMRAITTTVYQGEFSVYAGTNYLDMLENHLRNPLQGLRVVAAAPIGEEVSIETLALFGIDYYNPLRQMVFQMPGSQAILVWWIIGEETEIDGRYFRYIYSPHHEIIVEIPANTPPIQPAFWSVSDFANDSLYLRSIFFMSSVEISSTDVPQEFYNIGAQRINETFNLFMGQRINDDGSRDLIIDRITMESTGRNIPSPSDNVSGVLNFQRFMQVLMSTHVQHGVEGSGDIDIDNPHMTITITLENGDVDLLSFYFYSTTHTFFRLNDTGLTSVRTRSVIDILEWVDNVINGIDGRA